MHLLFRVPALETTTKTNWNPSKDFGLLEELLGRNDVPR